MRCACTKPKRFTMASIFTKSNVLKAAALCSASLMLAAGVAHANNELRAPIRGLRIQAPATPPSQLPLNCTAPWGATVQHGASVVTYATPSVPNGTACAPQARTCTDGVLSGSGEYQGCFVEAPPPPPANCTAPWGATVLHGSSVTSYLTPSVPNGSSCSPQTRTCSDGVLSGAGEHQGCFVEAPASPSTITVLWATYFSPQTEGSCDARPKLSALADGRTSRSFTVTATVLCNSDPALGYSKTLNMQYSCSGSGQTKSVTAPGSTVVTLTCP